MTSWNRGRENEQEGEQRMDSDNLGDKIAGAGQKVTGEAEQGVDNLGRHDRRQAGRSTG
jgi:hypothetical protein